MSRPSNRPRTRNHVSRRMSRPSIDITKMSTNSMIGSLLRSKRGSAKEAGPQRKAWVKWWSELVGTATAVTPIPRDQGPESFRCSGRKTGDPPSLRGGNALLTLSGFEPVEAVRAGDLVLTQDTATGALAFAPGVDDSPDREPARQNDRDRRHRRSSPPISSGSGWPARVG